MSHVRGFGVFVLRVSSVGQPQQQGDAAQAPELAVVQFGAQPLQCWSDRGHGGPHRLVISSRKSALMATTANRRQRLKKPPYSTSLSLAPRALASAGARIAPSVYLFRMIVVRCCVQAAKADPGKGVANQKPSGGGCQGSSIEGPVSSIPAACSSVLDANTSGPSPTKVQAPRAAIRR